MTDRTQQISAQVSVFYAVRDTVVGVERGLQEARLHERHLPQCEPVLIGQTSVEVVRPAGDEYPDASAQSYAVRSADVLRWPLAGMPDVVEVRLSILAPTFASVIEAVKDLYDPHVVVTVGGRDPLLMSQWVVPGHDAPRQGHRVVLIDLSESELSAATSPADRAALGQLLFKDTRMSFDVSSMSVGVPADLNASAGNEVYVWGEETVVWRMDRRLGTGWQSGMSAVSAFMVAAREAIEQRLHDVQALLRTGETPETALRRLVDTQAQHELVVQARLDALSVSLARPLASYAEVLAEHCRVAESSERFRRLVDQTLRAVSLEVQLMEKDAARRSASAAADVRAVVSIFAIVSVLANVIGLSVAITSVPPGNGSRYRHLEFGFGIALLFTALSVGVAVLLVVATRWGVSEAQRRRHLVVAGGAGIAAIAGVVLVWVARSGLPAAAGVGLAVVGTCIAAFALARTLRLSSSE